MKTAESADEFLDCAGDFQLGDLETEKPHPLTAELSSLARRDLPAAVDCLKAVDLAALRAMASKLAPATDLVAAIRATWAGGGRIFLAGCGATGRLSLSLEVFCRDGLVPAEYAERVIGFMAGGDAALIRSIEGFEDFPEYGARQLSELGFGRNDLLIASTEGGETPWVIGATEAAAQISEHRPWFLYCNPDSALTGLVERSRRVILHSGICKWNLAVGPMAIAGSTRMQASTVLEYAIGLALECAAGEGGGVNMGTRVRQFAGRVAALDWQVIVPFIEREAALYEGGQHLLYATKSCGVAVLTDTTERAPTFSLPIFESYRHGDTHDPLSLCYLTVEGAADAEDAWRKLLKRAPRCLTWPDGLAATRRETLMTYDIGAGAPMHRARACGREAVDFSIQEADGEIFWELEAHRATIVPAGVALLERQILLKLLLNAHSTLVMGRLGRYEGNLMTYVKPSNNKLIDRAIRYVQLLHARAHGSTPDYAQVCRVLFRERASLGADEPIVLKTLGALTRHVRAEI
jgi:N-acetylmuramic acid 6-phosphate etherase